MALVKGTNKICEDFPGLLSLISRNVYSLKDNLAVGSTNLSVEESLAVSKKFLRQMAQPFPREHQFGIRKLCEIYFFKYI